MKLIAEEVISASWLLVMKRKLPFVIFGILPFALLIDYSKLYFFRNFFSAVIQYLMIIYYSFSRNSTKNKVDKTLIYSLSVIFISELLLGLVENEVYVVIINTIGFFIAQNLLMRVFREEGTQFPELTFKRHGRSWRFTLIVFIVFLAVLSKIPTLLLFPSLLFCVQLSFLYWMAELRPVSLKSKNLVVFGIIGFMITQFFYLIGDYLYPVPFKATIYLSLYTVVFFGLVHGILIHANSKKN